MAPSPCRILPPRIVRIFGQDANTGAVLINFAEQQQDELVQTYTHRNYFRIAVTGGVERHFAEREGKLGRLLARRGVARLLRIDADASAHLRRGLDVIEAIIALVLAINTRHDLSAHSTLH